MPKARFTTISIRTKKLLIEDLSTQLPLEEVVQYTYPKLISKKYTRPEFLVDPVNSKFMKAMFTLIWLLNNDRFVGHWIKPKVNGVEDTDPSHWNWSADELKYGWIKYVALLIPFKQTLLLDDKKFLKAYDFQVSDERKKLYKKDLSYQLTFDYKKIEPKPSQYGTLVTDQYGRFDRSRLTKKEQFVFKNVNILGVLHEMGVLRQEELDKIDHTNKHTEKYSQLHFYSEDVEEFLKKISFDKRIYKELAYSIEQYKYHELLFKRLKELVNYVDTVRDPIFLGKSSFKRRITRGLPAEYGISHSIDIGKSIKDFLLLRGGTWKQIQLLITDLAGVSSDQIQRYLKYKGYTSKTVPKGFYKNMFKEARDDQGITQKPALFRYSFEKSGEPGNIVIVESDKKSVFLKKMKWLQQHDYFPRSIRITKKHNYERLQEAIEEKMSTKAICQHYNTLLQESSDDNYSKAQAFSNLKKNTCRPTTGIATTHKRDNEREDLQDADNNKEADLKKSSKKRKAVIGSSEDIFAWQHSSRESILHERNLCSTPASFFDFEKDKFEARSVIKAYQYKNNKILQEVDVHNSIFKISSANNNKHFQAIEKDLVDNFIYRLFYRKWKGFTPKRREGLLEIERKKRSQYKLLLTSWAFSSMYQIRYFIRSIHSCMRIIETNKRNFPEAKWSKDLKKEFHQIEGYDRYQFLLYLFCKLDLHSNVAMIGNIRHSKYHCMDGSVVYTDSDTGDMVCLRCFYEFLKDLRKLYLQWMYARIGSTRMARKIFLYETQVETAAACLCGDPDLCILYDAVLTNKPEHFKKCLDSSYAMLRCGAMEDFLFLMTRCLQLKKNVEDRQRIIHAYLDPYMKLLCKVDKLNPWNRKKLDNEYLEQVKGLKEKFCKELDLWLTDEEQELSKIYYWLNTRDVDTIEEAKANIYYLPLTVQKRLYGKDTISSWIGRRW